MNRLLALLVLLLALPAAPALAGRAETMLIPQRIVLEPGQRYATLIIKNSGDATGAYTVELVDMEMSEQGAITQLPPEAPQPEFSARPYVRVAPRSVTLNTGESQNVRILAQRPEGMAAGEYRSHIKVRIVNDNVDASPASSSDLTITVRPSIVMVIPLIIRQGETSFKAGVSGRRVAGREIEVTISREGNRSAEGNLRVYLDRGGSLADIGGINGVPVYREATRRVVRLKLDAEPDGPLVVRYEQPAKDDKPASVLAETRIP